MGHAWHAGDSQPRCPARRREGLRRADRRAPPVGQGRPGAPQRRRPLRPPVAAVYFGVAAAARDEAVRVVCDRRSGDGHPLAQDPTSQRLIGLMDHKLKVAWWSLAGALGELGEDYTPDEAALALVMLAKRQVVTEAVEVVGLAMEAVGGSAYFRRSPLERAYRDVRAGMFHPINPEKTLIYAGRMALGQPVETIW